MLMHSSKVFVPKNLSRREQQVLEGLKRGLSEKQVALRLKISRHTVHVYVKAIYQNFGVTSRPELLSLWIMIAEQRAMTLFAQLQALRRDGIRPTSADLNGPPPDELALSLAEGMYTDIAEFGLGI